jgi:hypothetical protein
MSHKQNPDIKFVMLAPAIAAPEDVGLNMECKG